MGNKDGREDSKMRMMDTIRTRRDEVYAIAKRHKTERLWVFGSCARGEETPESDVDFLVKYGDGASLFDAIRLERELAVALGRDVDVVSSAVLPRERRFAAHVCREAVPL